MHSKIIITIPNWPHPGLHDATYRSRSSEAPSVSRRQGPSAVTETGERPRSCDDGAFYHGRVTWSRSTPGLDGHMTHGSATHCVCDVTF